MKVNIIINKLSKIFKIIINHLIDLIKKYWGFIFIPIIFVVIDLFTRLRIREINIANLRSFSPNLFTFSYILLVIGILLFFKGQIRKILVGIILSVCLVLFLVNIVYFDIFNSFFSFNALAIIGEGTGYFKDVLMSLSPKIIITTLILITLIIFAIKFTPKQNGKLDLLFAILFICLSFGSRNLAIVKLGPSVDPLQWNAWHYQKNIYDSNTDSKKTLKISGFFEYVFRDFYLSNISKNSINKEEYVNYLSGYFTPSDELNINQDEYTGIFEDKNVIVVLMESIDGWLVNDEMMPNLNNLMKNGLNFTNHFSVIYGGGATFNSEFMINTGYMTPFNSKLAAYSYSENAYSNSLAYLFKKKGYSVNNFHYNTSSFYNRGDMTIAFGYEKYNSAYEMGYGTASLHDTLFMSDDKLKDLMLPDKRFMTFFTSYSAHMPYTLSNHMCKSLSQKYGVSESEIMENENLNCLKVQAKETDNFFKLLIDSLKEKRIYDDTVIIGVTDHYLYTYPDEDYVFEQKGYPDENFIHNVPFFIWSSDIKPFEIHKINSNLDVLPTIASLFNLDYIPSYYLGSNIFSNDYQEFVFFADYSWYDGKRYYKDEKVVFGEEVTIEEVKANNEKINKILDVNSKVLESNYFANIK